jgi:hypothetical protein
MIMNADGFTQKEHLDAFWFYLKELGIASHRSGVVNAIAEKVDIMMPDMYLDYQQ